MRLLALLGLTFLFSNTAFSQVGIGTLTPNSSTALEISSTDKGIMIPRVALTSTSDNTTISVTATEESLLVYNTSTVADVIPGFYYWTGTQWSPIGSGSTSNPEVRQQTISAEYPNASLNADGTDNLLNLTSDSRLIGAKQVNYYEAFNSRTDGGTNDYDVVFQLTVPPDFIDWTTGITLEYQATADATIEADTFLQGNAAPLKDNTPQTGTGLGGLTALSLGNASELSGVSAGDVLVFVFKLTVTDATNIGDSIARIADITLDYNGI